MSEVSDISQALRTVRSSYIKHTVGYIKETKLLILKLL